MLDVFENVHVGICREGCRTDAEKVGGQLHRHASLAAPPRRRDREALLHCHERPSRCILWGRLLVLD
jgi:hypothetical protein